jgi:hypothetical protein
MMTKVRNTGGQDSPPDDLLAKLRKSLEHRWREITKESSIAPVVAWERGYRLEKTQAEFKRLGFGRSQPRAPALVIPRFSPSGEPILPQIKPDKPHVEKRNGKSRPRKYETPAGSGIRLSAESVAVSKAAIAEQLEKLDALVIAPIPEDFIEKNTKNSNVPEERNGLVNWNGNPQILWAFESAGLKLPATNKGILAEYEGNPLVDSLRALRKGGDVYKWGCVQEVPGHPG